MWPIGNDQYFSYAAAGHVAKRWRPFLTNEADAGGQALNAIQLFGYDKLGRQTETRTLLQREAGAAAIWSSDIAQYNAFGEITAKLRDENIADSVADETYAYYDYDNSGRLWRANAGTEAGGGVDTVYQYA